MTRQRGFSVLVFTFVVAQHYQLALVSNYPVTLGLVTGVAMWLLLIKSLPAVNVFAIAIAPVALALLNAGVSREPYSTVEFGRTLALLTFACVALSTVSSRLDIALLTGPALKRPLFLSLVVVSGISVIQAVTGSLGMDTFFNPWGSHQFLHEYDPLMQFSDVPRAHGFFLEPSYDAFVLCTVAVILLSLDHHPKTVTGILFVGLVATQSATGLLLAGVIAVLVLRRARVAGAFLLLATGALGVWLVGPYLVGRISSTADVGSSANYRLLAPLAILDETLTHDLLGHPLGSVQPTVSAQRLLLGTELGSSLDNGVYVIVYYFGWLGLIAVVTGGCVALALSFSRRVPNAVASAIPVWILGSLLFSGGVFNPEFILMTWLALCIYRCSFNAPPAISSRSGVRDAAAT